jgi:hypothetical protein
MLLKPAGFAGVHIQELGASYKKQRLQELQELVTRPHNEQLLIKGNSTLVEKPKKYTLATHTRAHMNKTHTRHTRAQVIKRRESDRHKNSTAGRGGCGGKKRESGEVFSELKEEGG